uniref:Ig-like domain-containing protein n=1 Tax=Anas platyrhynchos TaxID=8839 RepID=A0A8B9ZFJ0_ANAPL
AWDLAPAHSPRPCSSSSSPEPPGAEDPQEETLRVPSEHSVLEGGEVRLECQAEGQPPPQISWLKDGQPLQLVADGPRLSLGAVGPADTGVYVCVAANEAGEASRAFSLLVMGACLPWAGGADPGEQLRDDIPFIGDRDAQYFGVSYGWGNRKKGAGWV